MLLDRLLASRIEELIAVPLLLTSTRYLTISSSGQSYLTCSISLSRMFFPQFSRRRRNRSIEYVLIEIAIDPFSQSEERFHEHAILHNLPPVFPFSQPLTMDVVGTWQPPPLLPVDQHLVNFTKRGELLMRRRVVERVNDHPLTDQQIPADRHRRRKHDIGHNAHKEAVAKAISKMLLKKRHVEVIIRPFPEVVKASIEEAIHNDQQHREVLLVKESDDDEQNIHRCIVDHLKDKRLD